MWGLHIRFGFKELAPSLELDLMGFEDPQYLHVMCMYIHVYDICIFECHTLA